MVVGPPDSPRMITKGAVNAIVDVCIGQNAVARKNIDAFVAKQGAEGFRVLAMATRQLPKPIHPGQKWRPPLPRSRRSGSPSS